MSRRRRRKIVDTQSYILVVETDDKGVQWISVVLPTGQQVKMFDNEMRAEAAHLRVLEAVTSLNINGYREIESTDLIDIEQTVQMYQDAGWSEKEMKRKDLKVEKIVLVDF
jgi:hypothetical protein